MDVETQVPAPTQVIRNLSVLAYAQGFTSWRLNLPAWPIGALESPGALDCVGEMLAAGDMLTIATASGTAIRIVSKNGSAIRLERTI